MCLPDPTKSVPNFLARQHPELTCVLANEVELTRTFWLLVHADIRNLARVRVVSDFIAAEVGKESRLFALTSPRASLQSVMR